MNTIAVISDDDSNGSSWLSDSAFDASLETRLRLLMTMKHEERLLIDGSGDFTPRFVFPCGYNHELIHIDTSYSDKRSFCRPMLRKQDIPDTNRLCLFLNMPRLIHDRELMESEQRAFDTRVLVRDAEFYMEQYLATIDREKTWFASILMVICSMFVTQYAASVDAGGGGGGDGGCKSVSESSRTLTCTLLMIVYHMFRMVADRCSALHKNTLLYSLCQMVEDAPRFILLHYAVQAGVEPSEEYFEDLVCELFNHRRPQDSLSALFGEQVGIVLSMPSRQYDPDNGLYTTIFHQAFMRVRTSVSQQFYHWCMDTLPDDSPVIGEDCSAMLKDFSTRRDRIPTFCTVNATAVRIMHAPFCAGHMWIFRKYVFDLLRDENNMHDTLCVEEHRHPRQQFTANELVLTLMISIPTFINENASLRTYPVLGISERIARIVLTYLMVDVVQSWDTEFKGAIRDLQCSQNMDSGDCAYGLM